MSTLTLSNGTIEDANAQPETEPLENKPNEEKPTIFSAIPAALSRRFAILDVHCESPPFSNMGVPGPDGDVHDLGANGLISVANPKHPEFVSPEILEELPAECKEALIEAASQEWEWKSRWCSEVDDGARTVPLKSYAWFP
jgi:chromatin structure-remodeling complex protein RSC7